MFTTGQLLFAISFAIVFITITFFSYKKDKKTHKKHYKGTIWVLIGFLVFIGLLLAAKTFLKG